MRNALSVIQGDRAMGVGDSASSWALLVVLGAVALVGAAWAPSSAQAFCGFYVSGSGEGLYNDATQVVLMRDGKRTILSMQNHYDGPPEDFAMVVPVPVVLKQDDVKTLPAEVFGKVDQMDSPRLVEYWEQDPCPQPGDGMLFGSTGGMGSGGGGLGSMSGVGGGASPPAVKVEAQFEVGEYEVVILSATDSMALDTWLRAEKYNIPAGAAPMMGPYIESGMFFFVAKVNVKKVQRESGRAVLSPLRFHYDTDTFQLPVRLGLLNARGPQDLIVHVLASQRYEVANLPNVSIPTNIDVHADVKARFPEFYAALFDATVEANPSAVVTEYSWDARSCDPCPGPTLSTQDILTLGADVLPGQTTGGFILTRLHARYTADQLKDDLVFRAASPMQGGRESYSGAWGDPAGLETGATAGHVNNFQGRYIIRYPWTGEIACEEPRRGHWGGPPGGSAPPPMAARDSAFAKRGEVALASLITSTDPARQVAVDLSAMPPAPATAPPLFGGPMVSGGIGMSAAPSTTLAVGKVTVTGDLDEQIARRVLMQRRNQLRHCFDLALRANAGRKGGKLSMSWQVNTDGTVAGVKVDADKTDDPTISVCALRIVNSMRFPAQTAPSTVSSLLTFSNAK
jgi:hypothetical protein